MYTALRLGILRFFEVNNLVFFSSICVVVTSLKGTARFFGLVMFRMIACSILTSALATPPTVDISSTPPTVDISVSWDDPPVRTTATAATVEIDVMPHLARVNEGGSFDGFFAAVQNLGASYLRYSPWYAYPGVVVPELYPADCSANGRGSSWNSTLLDQIYADFMLAQCGPAAAKGACWKGRSVVPQLSTMPEWLYSDEGVNRSAQIPHDPWQFPSGNFGYYLVRGKPLKDPTCTAMAKYAARCGG